MGICKPSFFFIKRNLIFGRPTQACLSQIALDVSNDKLLMASGIITLITGSFCFIVIICLCTVCCYDAELAKNEADEQDRTIKLT